MAPFGRYFGVSNVATLMGDQRHIVMCLSVLGVVVGTPWLNAMFDQNEVVWRGRHVQFSRLPLTTKPSNETPTPLSRIRCSILQNFLIIYDGSIVDIFATTLA